MRFHNVELDKDVEYCLISFFKSGRTWLRIMIKKAVLMNFGLDSNDIIDLRFRELDNLKLEREGIVIPKIAVTHDDDANWKKPNELIKSKTKYKDKKVIFLVRDPRDIMVSAYFHQTYRVVNFQRWYSSALKQRIRPYKRSLSDYIYSEIGGIDTLLSFFNIWAKNKHIPKDFILVHYESLHQNPHKELIRIMDFIGLPSIGDDIINKAISFASFENMRRFEEQEDYPSGNILRLVDRQNKESYKTRRGKVGGFTDYLQKDDIENLTKRIKNELPPLYGYGF